MRKWRINRSGDNPSVTAAPCQLPLQGSQEIPVSHSLPAQDSHRVPGEALASPHPADFAIRFESQIGGVPNILDTFDGFIQKDLVLAVPNKAKTTYTPTEAELQYLWYLVESNGITSMPADMHAVQTGDIQVAVEPNTEYTITVRANGRIYTVRGDSVTGMVEGERNARFRSFVGHMYNFMVSTGQWKSLPQAQGGYE